MKVVCQNCRSTFDLPLTSAGKIDYDGCKNVFRVSYRLRTPCPSCRKILQLSPGAAGGALGIASPFEPDEATENFALTPEATLPRERAVGHDSPPATVRVTKIQPAPVAPVGVTKVKPFRFANQPPKRHAPLHVAVAKRRRSLVPLFKFLFGFLLAGASTAAVILTLVAYRAGGAPRAEPATPTELTQAKTAKPPLPDDPQGGPMEEFNLGSEETPPDIRVEPNLSSRESLKLPPLRKLTSGYGVRLDPFERNVSFHSGLDFKVEYRSEVKAALPGKVIRTGPFGSYGNVVFIEHADGYESRYAHLDKPLVKVGNEIKKGELIGLAGSTGRSTGTHIHFELLKDGKRIDPLRAKLLSRKS